MCGQDEKGRASLLNDLVASKERSESVPEPTNGAATVTEWSESSVRHIPERDRQSHIIYD